ncbi:hypothetical protein JXM67_08835 [candidate division WOR-3 bacterium]|nr:hypothetical protein [candidate division WOR-3 bacterium]
MADLMDLTKTYHETIRARLEKTGLSPSQLEVHKRILELAATSSDVNDLETKKEAEGLTFAISKTLSIDNWMVKAKAAKEAEDMVAAKMFADTAEAAKKATDNASLGAAIEEASTKGMEALREQEDIRNTFLDAVSAIFDYRNVHGGYLDKKRKFADNLKIHDTKLKSKGKSIAELSKVSTFRQSVPITDEQWQTVLKLYEEMQSPTVDPEAQAKLTEEVNAAKQALSGKSDEMKAVTEHINAKGTRMAYLGIAPKDAPGPYTFEKIWEGGCDE